MDDALRQPGRNGVGQSPLPGRVTQVAVEALNGAPQRPEPMDAPCTSPSLLPPLDGAPAYEMKFLLDADGARQVAAWAARTLPLDAHADLALGGAYHTVSLYLDTRALDVFHRIKPFRRRKLRVRRYGAEAMVFLERKVRKGDQVRKLRTAIPAGELALLDAPADEADWPGEWFREQVRAGGLRPVCLVGYERVAHTGLSADGPARLTLDRNVRCLPAAGWDVGDVSAGLPLLEGQAILELKFCGAMPALFKQLIGEMRLAPAAASKYRLGVRAWGLDGGRGADV